MTIYHCSASMIRCQATLVIAKLNRLARNVHFISDWLESGVDFVVVDDMPEINKYSSGRPERGKEWFANSCVSCHGPKGEVWKIQQDLDELLDLCMQLTTNDRRFIICTARIWEARPFRRWRQAFIDFRESYKHR